MVFTKLLAQEYPTIGLSLPLLIVLLLLLYIGLGFIPANIANKKGYSFGLYWLFGFFFFVPALIVSLCISDKNAIQQIHDYYRRRNESESSNLPPRPSLSAYRPYERGTLVDRLSGRADDEKLPELWRCSQCGEYNEKNTAYCKSCGQYK